MACRPVTVTGPDGSPLTVLVRGPKGSLDPEALDALLDFVEGLLGEDPSD